MKNIIMKKFKTNNLKSRIKKLILTVIFILSIIAYLISVYDFSKTATAISFKEEENIDDRYEKLTKDNNHAIVNSLKSAMKEKRINFYFSFVYEDLNESYFNKLTTGKSIIIYYNDNTKKLNTISNIDLENFKESIPTIKLKSKDELSKIVPEYIEIICDNLTINSSTRYCENLGLSTLLIGALIMLIYLLIFCLSLISIIRLKSKK